MWQLSAKVALTTAIVLAVSEVAKRSAFWGAVIASLPLTSLLAFAWLYVDTGDTQSIASLSHGIFWLALASLPLFLVLPSLLEWGWPFWSSVAGACAVTIGTYFALVWTLGRLHVSL